MCYTKTIFFIVTAVGFMSYFDKNTIWCRSKTQHISKLITAVISSPQCQPEPLALRIKFVSLVQATDKGNSL